MSGVKGKDAAARHPCHSWRWSLYKDFGPSRLVPAKKDIQGFPRPFKAIKGCPSLFKGFGGKIIFYAPAKTHSVILSKTLFLCCLLFKNPRPFSATIPSRSQTSQGVPSRSKVFSGKKRLFIFIAAPVAALGMDDLLARERKVNVPQCRLIQVNVAIFRKKIYVPPKNQPVILSKPLCCATLGPWQRINPI
jgi:hypothetical protein